MVNDEERAKGYQPYLGTVYIECSIFGNDKYSMFIVF
jgi:hypothetical protein